MIGKETANAHLLSNGHLLLTAGNDCRAALKRAKESSHYSEVAALYEALEPYWTNGGFQPFDAGDGRPFVGLTSAPCIAEGMDYPDDSEPVIVGRLWWYPDYMIRSPVDELIRRGRTVFKQA